MPVLLKFTLEQLHTNGVESWRTGEWELMSWPATVIDPHQQARAASKPGVVVVPEFGAKPWVSYAPIRHAAVIDQRIRLWALVLDPDPEKVQPLELFVAGTGEWVDPPAQHVATAVDGGLVWHVFQREPS